MKIQKLSDKELIAETDLVVRQERNVLMRALEYFKEIERRRLYSDYRHESLHSVLVNRWGYSSDEACRRIDAIHLLRELPEIEEKITLGEVSLTHLNLAQTMFKKEKRVAKKPLSTLQKLEVIEKISGQSTREAQKILIQHSTVPHALRRDRIFQVSETEIGLEFRAKSTLEDKIKTLKGMLAHQNPDISIGELFEKLCELGIEAWDPSRTKKKKRLTMQPAIAKNEIKAQSTDSPIKHEPAPLEPTTEITAKLPAAPRVNRQEMRPPRHKMLSSSSAKQPSAAATRRSVFQKALSKCTNCGSTYAPEVDHVIGRAQGGSNEIENLRLLCRSCNQRAAIQTYGLSKMSRHPKGNKTNTHVEVREISRRYSVA